MAGFLIFQPAAPGSDARRTDAGRRFERARDFLASTRGLAVQGEAGTGARAAKFARRDGSGAAPASSASGWLVSAGLWDHAEAPASNDTAWLLRALEDRGETVLDGLDGFFALAWLDARSGRLTVCPDHLGRLHLYAGDSPEGAWIATSATAVAGAIGAGPDPTGIFELLTTGTIYEDRSAFAGVRRLQAARRYVYRAGRLETKTSAPGVTPPPARAGRVLPADVAEACATRLVRLLRPFSRPCADLTGGRDSRLVVSLMLRAGLRFDLSVSGADDNPDVTTAKALAARLGLTIHHGREAARTETQGSFEQVLGAAALVDGVGDAVDLAGITTPRGVARGTHDVGISGAGGEVYRESWWKAKDIGSSRPVVERAIRRFTRSRAAVAVPFLGGGLRRDPVEHFSGVITRAAAPRAADPLPDQLDHLYLMLRAQCWQGTNASAVNTLQPRLYPLLLRSPLEKVLSLEARDKAGDRVFHALFEAMGPPFSTTPLATGFPPLEPGPATAWRFLARVPAWAKKRIAKKLRPRHRGRVDETMSLMMARLFAGGAADYLAPGALVLGPLLDKAPLEAFLATAARTGQVSPALVGRLIAAEFGLRAAETIRSG